MQGEVATNIYVVAVTLILLVGTLVAVRSLKDVAEWRKPQAWFRVFAGSAHLVLFVTAGLDILNIITVSQTANLVMLELAILLAALHILVASLTERYESKKLSIVGLANGGS